MSKGRGGVPVLPEGMWDSLQGITNTEKSNQDQDNLTNNDSKLIDNNIDDNDNDYNNEIPVSFGRSSTTSGGLGRGRGRGRQNGLERDVKGKDWDCPSCTNLNWSWRSTCNKCNTARPYVPKVMIIINL